MNYTYYHGLLFIYFSLKDIRQNNLCAIQQIWEVTSLQLFHCGGCLTANEHEDMLHWNLKWTATICWREMDKNCLWSKGEKNPTNQQSQWNWLPKATAADISPRNLATVWCEIHSALNKIDINPDPQKSWD